MRVFLIVLVGFLASLILILLVVAEQFSKFSREATTRQWNNAADLVTAQISAARSEEERRTIAQIAMSLHGIESLDVADTHLGISEPDGELIIRPSVYGPIRFSFDDSELQAIERRFTYIASICVAAAVTVIFLLALYLPRITRPIETMLDEAKRLGMRDGEQDDTTYLIQTFRESISRLQDQEAELKQLHLREKSRADELELVTATLTRSLTSGLITLDPDGRVVEINAAARETLQVENDPEPRVDLRALLGDSPLTDTLLRALQQRETLTRIEVEHDAISIGLTAVPLVGEEGRLLGMLALMTDLTPIKRLESRVRAMQTLAELGEISAGIAHEFRNSLSTIVGYLKLVGRSELPDEVRARLRAAQDEAGQLNEAVHGLLTFAKPMSLRIERVNLRELVDELIERLREQMQTRVSFHTNGEAFLDGDRILLGRAIENILRNAIDAVAPRGEEGRIDVELRADPPALIVSDNGVGFDDADGKRLLLPFISQKPGGFGLGLSLARKIAVLHGGEINLQGKPDAGAIVTIDFAKSV